MEKYPAVSRDENKLGSGRTCVDTEIGIALVGMYVGVSKVEFLVAVDELIVFRLRIKERFARNNVVGSLGAVYPRQLPHRAHSRMPQKQALPAEIPRVPRRVRES